MPKARGPKESKTSKPAKDPKDTPPRVQNREEKQLENLPISTPSPVSTTSMPSTASTSSEEDQEQGRGRTEREIEAIRRIYRATGSMEKVAEFFGISVSTVHRYCQGIVVPAEVRDQMEQTTPNGAETSAAHHGEENDDDHQGLQMAERPRPPRLDYEILATRPRVSEFNGEPDGSAERAPIMPLTGHDDWNEIVSQVRAAAWVARFRGSAANFYAERIVPDLEIADLCKTFAGSNDPDFVREALSIVWKKSLAFDRIQQQAGLSAAGQERQHKQPETGAFQN